MKPTKYLLPSLIALSLLTSTPALAQEATATITPSPKPTLTLRRDFKESREDLREKSKEDREDLREKIKENRQELKTQAKDQKKTLWTAFKKNRVEAIAKRLRLELTRRYDIRKALHDSIQKKIDTLVTEGKTVTAINAKFSEYTKFETAYTTDLSAFDAKVKEITSSDKPVSLLPGLHTASNKVKTDLNDMRKVLLDTVKLIKDLK